MIMTKYLGSHVSNMLESEPFKNWPVERSVENGLDEPRTYYIFKGGSLDVRCDSNDKVCVIFMHTEDYDGFTLSEIPFSLGREQVLNRFGSPSKSGGKISDPILGECGAWDRFTHADSAIHVEYRVDADEINKITLMQGDVVP